MINARLISRMLLFTAALNIFSGLASISDPRLHARLLIGTKFSTEGLMLRY